MDPARTAELVSDAIRRNLKPLRKLKPDALVNRRFKKFRSMGLFSDR
jgi:acetyl-CoA carboxylase alpha subunit